VNRRADRNRLERKRVADFRRRRRTAGNFNANLDADRRDDVTLFAVGILQERQPGRTHRIIFNRRDRRLDAVLVALEIHEADFLLVTAANTTRRHATIVVASTGFLPYLHQRFLRLRLRNIAEICERDVAQRRR
jgi:hypothetical protein